MRYRPLQTRRPRRLLPHPIRQVISRLPRRQAGDLFLFCFRSYLFAWLCRRASKRTPPVATEPFNDFTGPVVGRETTKSQHLRVSSCKPPPSPPSTIPVADV